MTHYEQSVDSKYHAKQLYDIVIDIEKYPEFLPWCIEAKILENNLKIIKAELSIGLKNFSQSYVSEVKSILPENEEKSYIIEVKAISGPFKQLLNSWKFTDLESGGCKVEFVIDFAFTNPLFESFIGRFFNKAIEQMVNAFESRAEKLYG